jgi:tRNA threonylcarbamoyladenosine modification (KEOPS) complex Cgi121 subunit
LTVTYFKVGDVELFLTYVRGMPQGWEEKLNKLRGLFQGVYIQAVNGHSIIDAEHAGHVAFNVLQAHRFGYNKLKNAEAESIMNLAFKNSFAEALQLVGVKSDCPVALFSFSRMADVASNALKKVIKELNVEQIEPQSFQGESVAWLAKSFSLEANRDITTLKKLLIERSSVFYAKYRAHPPNSKPSLET